MMGTVALLVVLAVAVALLAALLVALGRVIAADGRGHRTPPRSRRRWDEGTTAEVPW